MHLRAEHRPAHYRTLLCSGLQSFMYLERINLWDTFVSVLESLGQGAIDRFSPSANFCHHLHQVDWCGWQRSPLRQFMNMPMRIFNNRKACKARQDITSRRHISKSTWEILGHAVASGYACKREYMHVTWVSY